MTNKLWIEGDPLLEEIARSNDIVVVEDARTDPRTNKKLVEAFGNRSIFNIPIQLAEKKLGVIGTGTFEDEGEYHLTLEQREYLIALGQCVAIVLDRLMAANQRKQAFEALQESEARLLTSLHLGRISLWELDLATQQLQFPSQSPHHLGFENPEISTVGEDWKRRLHPDDQQQVRQKIRAFISDPKIHYEDEFRILHKNGEYRWVRLQGDLKRDDSGNPLRIMGYQIDIHERKLMEVALLESESNLRFALMMGNIGLWSWDLTNNAVTLSDEWKQQIGYERDEIGNSYETWSSRVHPDDIEIALQNLQATITDPLSRYDMVYRFRHKDDTYRWIHCVGNCLRDADGQPLKMYGCHLDITERKLKEESLRESESNLRLALKLGNIGLWGMDLVTGKLQVSAEWGCQLGYGVEELEVSLEKFQTMIHPDDAGPIREKVQSFLEDPKDGLKLEYRIRHKNGTYRWVFTEGELLRDTAGKPVRVLGCRIDITERKQAEMALKEDKAQLRTFIQHAPVAMAMLDLNMNYLVASGEWRRLFSNLNVELEGRNHYDCHLDLPAHWLEAHVKALSGETVAKENDLWVQADGTRTWSNWVARPWYDSNGAIGGIILMGVDITHQKELEHEVVHISTEEQKRIGQDLHDTLSQELTALSMMTADLSEALHSAPSEVVQLVERIEKGLQRGRSELRSLMNGLLPISIDDTQSLIKALSELAALTQDMGKRKCIVDCHENFKVSDHIVATHLYLIAQEAVHNAVKHSNPGTIRIVLASDPVLSLQVENDGHSIVIQPKENTKGLGVRIMKNRAAIIGGSLWIEPIKPNGTRVTCQLKGASNER